MDKSTSIMISIALVVGFGMIIHSSYISNKTTNIVSGGEISNTVIKDGVQYVTINAKGGYSPNKSTAQAGIPTKLIVKTDGTYDCSSALVINSIGYREILPQTAETEIDIGTKQAGETLQGMCSMGMYSFEVTFS